MEIKRNDTRTLTGVGGSHLYEPINTTAQFRFFFSHNLLFIRLLKR